MRTWIWRLAVLGLLVVTEAASASPPSYMPSYLLVSPAAAPPHRASRLPAHPGYGMRLPAAGYSYGWFGAEARRHGEIHRGYYGNYLEWSRR